MRSVSEKYHRRVLVILTVSQRKKVRPIFLQYAPQPDFPFHRRLVWAKTSSALKDTTKQRYRCLLTIKAFASGNQAEKVDLCKYYWNLQRKIGVATHFFKIINLGS